jgi:hypothetical protein
LAKPPGGLSSSRALAAADGQPAVVLVQLQADQRGPAVQVDVAAAQPGRLAAEAALAIRARIPLDVLLDQVARFPTYTEAYLAALEQLAR